MTGYVPGEQPGHSDIIKLNTNENPYPPSPSVQALLSGFDPALLTRYPDPVCMALRERLGEIHDCSVEQILVGNGSDELLALCLRAFVEQEGSVGYFQPSYSLYPILAAIQDLRTKPVELTNEFRWSMPENYQASIFFLTHPNAPTGMVYDLAVIRDFCEHFEGIVVIDEAYVDFAETDCLSLVDEYDNVLILRTLSKSYSLAGIRLGYMIGSSSLMRALYKVKDSYNVNRVSQMLGLAALNDLPHMQVNAEKIITTREKVRHDLLAMGMQVFPSQANFLWIKPAAAMISAKQLFLTLKEEGILLRHFDEPTLGEYLRVSIGTNEQMDLLLEKMRTIINTERTENKRLIF